jgi:hypothetical protein
MMGLRDWAYPARASYRYLTPQQRYRSVFDSVFTDTTPPIQDLSPVSMLETSLVLFLALRALWLVLKGSDEALAS